MRKNNTMAKKVLNQPKEYTNDGLMQRLRFAESPEHEAAVRLADKVKAGALPSPFTAKDVYKNHWHGLKEKQEVDAACNILIDENWLKMATKPKPATGRPPLPEYYINPVFLIKHDHPEVSKVAKPHLDTLDTLGYRHLQKKNNDDDDSIEVKPDSDGTGYDAPSPTRPESTLTRNGAGAGPDGRMAGRATHAPTQSATSLTRDGLGAGENKITQAPESFGNKAKGNHGNPIKTQTTNETYTEWLSRTNPKPKRKP